MSLTPHDARLALLCGANRAQYCKDGLSEQIIIYKIYPFEKKKHVLISMPLDSLKKS